MPRLSSRREHLLAVALFALVLLVWFWPLLRGHQLGQGHILYDTLPWSSERPPDLDTVPRSGEGDEAFQWRPLLSVAREQVHAGQLPLWNPYSYGGTPLFGDFQTALLYPLTWLALIFPIGDAWGAIALLKLLTAGLGAYFLARRFRAELAGGLVAGIGYMLSAPLMYWLQWPVGTVYSVLPWLLLASDRLYRRPGAPRVGALAAVVALMLLAGHPESAMLGACSAVVYVGALALVDRARARRERAIAVAQLVAAHALGAGLAAVAIVPFLGAFDDSLTKEIHGEGTQHLPAWAALVWALPGYFGDGRPAVYGFLSFTPIAAYAGVVTLLLAGVAAVRLRRHPATIALAAVGVVALMLALWIPPVSWLASILPVLSQSNLYGRLFFIPALLIAVGAGVGVASLLRRPLPVRSVVVATGVLVGAVGLYLVVDHFDDRLIAPHDVEMRALRRFAVFVVLGAACLVALGRLRRTAAVGATLAVVVADLAFMHGYNVILPERQMDTPATPALARLDREPRPFRISVIRAPDTLMLPPNTPARFGLENVEGYDFPQSNRWFLFSAAVLGHVGPDTERRLARGAPDRPALTALRMMNVRYYVADPGTRRPHPDFRAVHSGRDATVFQDPLAFPRAYVVASARTATDEQALAALGAGDLDPRREALVPPGAELPPAGGGLSWRAAGVEPSAPDEVRVRVPDGPAGRLVLAASYSDQWKAELDGRPVAVEPTNYVAMGVVVPGGSHLVTFRYDRGPLVAGAAVSGLSLLLIAALWANLPARVRRRRAR